MLRLGPYQCCSDMSGRCHPASGGCGSSRYHPTPASAEPLLGLQLIPFEFDCGNGACSSWNKNGGKTRLNGCSLQGFLHILDDIHDLARFAANPVRDVKIIIT